MEFIEPVVATPEPSSPKVELEANKHTEEAIHQLEDEIDKGYTAVEQRLAALWTSYQMDAKTKQLGELLEGPRAQLTEEIEKRRVQLTEQLKLARELDQVKELEKKLSELPITQAKENLNKGLDAVDSQLEKIENAAMGYVLLFTLFLLKVVTVEPEQDETTTKETLFSREEDTPNFMKHYGTLRYEQELYKLHTDTKLYTNPIEDEEAANKIDVEGKTEEITGLLAKYPALQHTMLLVLATVDYKTFWTRYYSHLAQLEENEKKRQALKGDLKLTGDDDDDEDFTWSDDDDDNAGECATKTEEKKSVLLLEKQTPDTSNEDDDDWE